MRNGNGADFDCLAILTVAASGTQPDTGVLLMAGLPTEATALVGREKELERVGELLCRGDVRLVRCLL